MKRAWLALQFCGLAMAALILMAWCVVCSPYFLWKWLREERRHRADMARNITRGGYYDHP